MLAQRAPVVAVIEQQAKVVLLERRRERARPEGGGGRGHVAEDAVGQLRQVPGAEEEVRPAGARGL